MNKIKVILFIAVMGMLQQCSYSQTNTAAKQNINQEKKEIMDSTDKKLTKENNPVYSTSDSSKVNLTDAEWKKILPEEVYYIARMKGTERPWTSKFEGSKDVGTYYCAACGNPLFKSDT